MDLRFSDKPAGSREAGILAQSQRMLLQVMAQQDVQLPRPRNPLHNDHEIEGVKQLQRGAQTSRHDEPPATR